MDSLVKKFSTMKIKISTFPLVGVANLPPRSVHVSPTDVPTLRPASTASHPVTPSKHASSSKHLPGHPCPLCGSGPGHGTDHVPSGPSLRPRPGPGPDDGTVASDSCAGGGGGGGKIIFSKFDSGPGPGRGTDRVHSDPRPRPRPGLGPRPDNGTDASGVDKFASGPGPGRGTDRIHSGPRPRPGPGPNDGSVPSTFCDGGGGGGGKIIFSKFDSGPGPGRGTDRVNTDPCPRPGPGPRPGPDDGSVPYGVNVGSKVNGGGCDGDNIIASLGSGPGRGTDQVHSGPSPRPGPGPDDGSVPSGFCEGGGSGNGISKFHSGPGVIIDKFDSGFCEGGGSGNGISKFHSGPGVIIDKFDSGSGPGRGTDQLQTDPRPRPGPGPDDGTVPSGVDVGSKVNGGGCDGDNGIDRFDSGPGPGRGTDRVNTDPRPRPRPGPGPNDSSVPSGVDVGSKAGGGGCDGDNIIASFGSGPGRGTDQVHSGPSPRPGSGPDDGSVPSGFCEGGGSGNGISKFHSGPGVIIDKFDYGPGPGRGTDSVHIGPRPGPGPGPNDGTVASGVDVGSKAGGGGSHGNNIIGKFGSGPGRGTDRIHSGPSPRPGPGPDDGSIPSTFCDGGGGGNGIGKFDAGPGVIIDKFDSGPGPGRGTDEVQIIRPDPSPDDSGGDNIIDKFGLSPRRGTDRVHPGPHPRPCPGSGPDDGTVASASCAGGGGGGGKVIIGKFHCGLGGGSSDDIGSNAGKFDASPGGRSGPGHGMDQVPSSPSPRPGPGDGNNASGGGVQIVDVGSNVDEGGDDGKNIIHNIVSDPCPHPDPENGIIGDFDSDPGTGSDDSKGIKNDKSTINIDSGLPFDLSSSGLPSADEYDLGYINTSVASLPSPTDTCADPFCIECIAYGTCSFLPNNNDQTSNNNTTNQDDILNNRETTDGCFDSNRHRSITKEYHHDVRTGLAAAPHGATRLTPSGCRSNSKTSGSRKLILPLTSSPSKAIVVSIHRL